MTNNEKYIRLDLLLPFSSTEKCYQAHYNNYSKGDLILYSDQGSQYTSKAFVKSCEAAGVTQSMSKAGYPYNNAPMERYFNTLKNECANLYEFRTEEALYQAIEKFAYVTYNHVRPHSFNGYRTPFQARAV